MSVRMNFYRYMGPAAVGGWAKFFEPGTSTLKTTYEDDYSTAATLNSANGVPINSSGILNTYLSGDYDMTVFGSTGTELTALASTGINPQESDASTLALNLLANGSFETDTDGYGVPNDWVLTSYSGGTNVLDTADKSHGANSMKFTSTGSGGGILVSDDFIPISPLKAVEVSFMLKSTADVRNLVEAIWYTAGGTEISDTDIYDNSTTNPTAWTRKGSTVIPPATAYQMKIRIYGCHSSDATSGTARFDDFEVRQVDTSFTVANSFSPPPLRLFISGFVPTAGVDTDHDLSFSTGVCRNSTNTAWCLPTWTTLIKQIDAAWAEGTNAGCMATGSVANSTAYYYNLIRKNADETVFDIVCDVSSSQANTPSGWTFMREIHREFTDGSANLQQQTYKEISGGGIRCWLKTVSRSFSDTDPGADLVTKTLAVPPSLEVHGSLYVVDTTASSPTEIIFNEVGSAATEPGATLATLVVPANATSTVSSACSELSRYVDASRNVEYEMDQSTVSHEVNFYIIGWTNDRRT